jgi:hypothetical protein
MMSLKGVEEEGRKGREGKEETQLSFRSPFSEAAKLPSPQGRLARSEEKPRERWIRSVRIKDGAFCSCI